MWIVVWIIMFAVLIILHEMGHFLAARRSGVHVEEFGLGIPPRVVTLYTDSHGTKYSINAIPLGGFVRIQGEDPLNEDEFHHEKSLHQASLAQKIFILIAWILVNLSIGWVILTGLFATWLKPIFIVPDNMMPDQVQSYLVPTQSFLRDKWFIEVDNPTAPILIDAVMTWMIAYDVWILPGDVITRVDGTDVDYSNFSEKLRDAIGKTINMDITRWTEMINVDAVCPDDNCMLGVSIGWVSASFDGIQFPWHQAPVVALQEIQTQWKLTFSMLGKLVVSIFTWTKEEKKDNIDQLTWPVGAVKLGSTIVENGWWKQFAAFTAMISIALWLFNLLPIPALDGGRIVWVVVQRVFNLSSKKFFMAEWYLNFGMFILLMIFGVYIIIKDLSRFWGIG